MAKEIKKTMKSIIDNKNRGSVKIWLLFVGIILAYHLLFREYTGDAVEYFSAIKIFYRQKVEYSHRGADGK